eukprot:CAMPEP_0179907254 /NCGR_PEP_ID=MMETSP0982-20121206/43769_1 /TAXON_ID=483367 /ORGANISM="non described non described, Strain CCMP 2436" /LENGTH=40 /DNA_ID= /DNA_START= /DNA_END= /DNA_ORIENTATION=
MANQIWVADRGCDRNAGAQMAHAAEHDVRASCVGGDERLG